MIVDPAAQVPPGIPAPRSAPPLDQLPPPSRWKRTGGSHWTPIVLGAWLCISIVMWPHGRDAQMNAWGVGVAMMGSGALSLFVPWMRWVSALLGLWLCLSTLAVEHLVRATPWNHLLVGIVVLATSLTSAASDRHGRARREARRDARARSPRQQDDDSSTGPTVGPMNT